MTARVYETPFAYPKSRHVRRHRPGPFSAYQAYKPFLRDEFERKCVYCRMPVTMKDEESFGVDHYRPKKRFPAQETTYSNLFFCCNPCNRRKGDYWPEGRLAKTHFIPNPCDHEMFRHLRFRGGEVQVKSGAGEVAEELLDLNDERTVGFRKMIAEMIDVYRRQRADAERVFRELTALRAERADDADLERDIATVSDDLDRIDAHLTRLTGA